MRAPRISRGRSSRLIRASTICGSRRPRSARTPAPISACRRSEIHVAKRVSAGILLHRLLNGTLEVFLVHPGGPFWRGKDAGAWSIPKGEVEEGDDLLKTAQREFEEETGSRVSGEFFALKPLKQKSGKLVH